MSYFSLNIFTKPKPLVKRYEWEDCGSLGPSDSGRGMVRNILCSNCFHILHCGKQDDRRFWFCQSCLAQYKIGSSDLPTFTDLKEKSSAWTYARYSQKSGLSPSSL